MTAVIALLYYCMFVSKKLGTLMCKPENAFLLGALVLGTLYLVIMPIFKIPDSGNHYVRAYGIAKGYFLVPRGGMLDIPGNLIPYRVYAYSPYILMHHFGNVLSGETVSYDVVNMALYSPLNYILQSAGIFIAGVFCDNSHMFVLMGSLFNFIGTVTILYYSVKYIPYGKWILCFLSLLPMTMQERSSLAADALTFAMVAAMVSFTLYFRYEDYKVLTARSYVLMYIIMIFTASCKIVYFVTAGLILLIPGKCFGSKKKERFHKICSMVLLFVLSVGWFMIAQSYLGTTRGGGDAAAKLDIILHQPFRYVYIVNKVIWDEGAKYLLEAFGSNLGTTDIAISPLLLMTGLLFLGRLFYMEYDRRKKPDGMVTAFTLLQSAGMVLLVFTSLYIQWTNISAAVYTIEGIQGRYLLPIGIVLMTGLLAEKREEAAEKTDESAADQIKRKKYIFGLYVINVICLLTIWGFTSQIG